MLFPFRLKCYFLCFTNCGDLHENVACVAITSCLCVRSRG